MSSPAWRKHDSRRKPSVDSKFAFQIWIRVLNAAMQVWLANMEFLSQQLDIYVMNRLTTSRNSIAHSGKQDQPDIISRAREPSPSRGCLAARGRPRGDWRMLTATMAAARRARRRRRRPPPAPPPPCTVVQPLPSQCLPQAQNSDPEICSGAQATQGAMWRDRNVCGLI